MAHHMWTERRALAPSSVHTTCQQHAILVGHLAASVTAYKAQVLSKAHVDVQTIGVVPATQTAGVLGQVSQSWNCVFADIRHCTAG